MSAGRRDLPQTGTWLSQQPQAGAFGIGHLGIKTAPATSSKHSRMRLTTSCRLVIYGARWGNAETSEMALEDWQDMGFWAAAGLVYGIFVLFESFFTGLFVLSTT